MLRLVIERLSGDSRTAELAAHTQDNGDTNNVIVSILVILGVVIFVINIIINVSIVSTLIIAIIIVIIDKIIEEILQTWHYSASVYIPSCFCFRILTLLCPDLVTSIVRGMITGSVDDNTQIQ